MISFPSPKTITARDFELLVKSWLEAGAGGLSSFSASHLQILAGQDGEYSFDVVAEFSALGGARITVLVECKKHANSIKRELVQVLNDKKRSVGAHKAMLVATAPFQSGAIEFAEKNGIALVQVVSGSAVYIKASLERSPLPKETRAPPEVAPSPPTPSAKMPDPLVGLFYGRNPKRDLIYPQLLSSSMSQEMELFLHGQ